MGRCSTFHKKEVFPTTANRALIRLEYSVWTPDINTCRPVKTSSAIMKGRNHSGFCWVSRRS